MRQTSGKRKSHGEKIVKDIRRATRRQYSAEEKIRIVLDGLRGEDTIAELCRREGIAQGLYYSWSKEFLEAGTRRLASYYLSGIRVTCELTAIIARGGQPKTIVSDNVLCRESRVSGRRTSSQIRLSGLRRNHCPGCR